MKFLADMGISPAIVRRLREQGYNAIHLHEQGLIRLSDADILKKAQNESRVLLTHDLDFGELLALSGEGLPSIIIFRLSDMRPQNVWLHLEAILAQHSQTIEQGALLSVRDRKVRVRTLPI